MEFAEEGRVLEEEGGRKEEEDEKDEEGDEEEEERLNFRPTQKANPLRNHKRNLNYASTQYTSESLINESMKNLMDHNHNYNTMMMMMMPLLPYLLYIHVINSCHIPYLTT